MSYFNIVAETSENTVVTEYEPVKRRSDSYQSEAELEQEFIRMLCEQGYEYLPIHTEKDLIENLRMKLSELHISSIMILQIQTLVCRIRHVIFRRIIERFLSGMMAQPRIFRL